MHVPGWGERKKKLIVNKVQGRKEESRQESSTYGILFFENEGTAETDNTTEM